MASYVIITDSACDISEPILRNDGVCNCYLTYTFEGDDAAHTRGDMTPKDFYDALRSGKTAHTSALNIQDFKSVFANEFEKGEDVFYLAFSSGLSSTYSSAVIAAEELKDDYPERRAIIVDSLSASAGYGLLVFLAVQKKREGADIDELRKYCEDIRLNVCHWFTVDDLKFLKRGGRISSTTAFAGTLLGIKPILHVDDEGHLINMAKVKGRKAAIKALADKYAETRDESLGGTIFISHADCRDDADALAAMLHERHGVETQFITQIGPVIGAHSGPGTLALFFLGKQR